MTKDLNTKDIPTTSSRRRNIETWLETWGPVAIAGVALVFVSGCGHTRRGMATSERSTLCERLAEAERESRTFSTLELSSSEMDLNGVSYVSECDPAATVAWGFATRKLAVDDEGVLRGEIRLLRADADGVAEAPDGVAFTVNADACAGIVVVHALRHGATLEVESGPCTPLAGSFQIWRWEQAELVRSAMTGPTGPPRWPALVGNGDKFGVPSAKARFGIDEYRVGDSRNTASFDIPLLVTPDGDLAFTPEAAADLDDTCAEAMMHFEMGDRSMRTSIIAYGCAWVSGTLAAVKAEMEMVCEFMEERKAWQSEQDVEDSWHDLEALDTELVRETADSDRWCSWLKKPHRDFSAPPPVRLP